LEGGMPRSLDFVRIDLEAFEAEATTRFLEACSVGHFCGEADDKWIDPLELYRLCSERTGSFYVYFARGAHATAGHRDAQEYEITVVVPVFNIDRYLDQCLESLAFQTI